jgi:hypothetical protein
MTARGKGAARPRIGRAATLLAALLASSPLPRAADALAADPLAVALTSASVPVACAEEDNVTIKLASATVRRFRLAATHPAYLTSLGTDSFAADWSNCPRPATAPSAASPVRTTLYEQVDLWLVGLTFPSFWRPVTATVRVGDRVARNVHLLQLWMLRPMGGEEVLVLYPGDGYWRLRPLAPAGRAPTAFGSSFLIGPVEDSARPFVAITDILFAPQERTFTVTFERGGSARIQVASLDQQRHALDIAFDRPIDGRPFAALRSMYVTEYNNDVARIAVRERNGNGWRETAIMDFTHALATEVWAGRTVPSRHNTSSPDMEFGPFAADK